MGSREKSFPVVSEWFHGNFEDFREVLGGFGSGSECSRVLFTNVQGCFREVSLVLVVISTEF